MYIQLSSVFLIKTDLGSFLIDFLTVNFHDICNNDTGIIKSQNLHRMIYSEGP